MILSSEGLDAFFYGVYSGSRFIIIGTPSGLTLGPEGGAHQSILTPSIGIEMPELDFYEPCFGRELEWIMLSAMEKIRLRTRSTYLRLSTKRVDQSLLKLPDNPEKLETMRRQALSGAYRLIDRRTETGFGHWPRVFPSNRHRKNNCPRRARWGCAAIHPRARLG